MIELSFISIEDAKSLGLKRYCTLKPCKNGHFSERYCRDRQCVQCKADKYSKYFAENKEKENKRSLEYRNKDVEKARLSAISWAKQNPGKKARLNAAWRSKKLSGTPSWLNKEQLAQISFIYEEAHRLTRETGTNHHVDHIVPLNGRKVSGLHVPWNLQILTFSENCSKGNKFYD